MGRLRARYAEGCLLAGAPRRLDRSDGGPASLVPVPATLSQRDPAATSTQAAFGRVLLDLSRVEGVSERLVTVAPDVSASTNLGGFINGRDLERRRRLELEGADPGRRTGSARLALVVSRRQRNRLTRWSAPGM